MMEKPAGTGVAPWAVPLSVVLQAPLAIFLGHYTDARIFMATGFLAGTGLNPYVPRDLSGVFGSTLFAHLTSIGYPPPWSLILGLAYRVSYALSGSIFLYNFALKVPVIAANVLLAFATGDIVRKLGAAAPAQRAAILFMLFNPLLLYTTAAWGQFDTAVALCSLVGICCLYEKRPVWAGALLALAVSLKPTAVPLIALAILMARLRGRRVVLTLAASMAATFAALCVAPFLVFHWDAGIILRNPGAHSLVAGGMSWLTFFEFIFGTSTIPVGLRFLGFLWLPALAAATVLLRPRPRETLADLLHRSLRLLFVFYLSRAWLSEPNVDLLLPFAVALQACGRLSRGRLLALWLVPLGFTVLNASPPQLLFLVWPGAIPFLSAVDETVRALRLLARCAIVVPWLTLGWYTVLDGRRSPIALATPVPPRENGEGNPPPSAILPTFTECPSDARAATAVTGDGNTLRRCPAARFMVGDSIALSLVERTDAGLGYPSSAIPRGLAMSCGPLDLCEEGVGFGVPIIKQSRETIFPGSVHVSTSAENAQGTELGAARRLGISDTVAEFDMNLVERLAPVTRSRVLAAALNLVREPLALLHRRYPVLRRALSAVSHAVRAGLGIRTTFQGIRSRGVVTVTYRWDARGVVEVHLDARGLRADGCLQLIVMNEQGAHYFDRYRDAAGRVLQGGSIETWKEVSAESASFEDARHGLSFTLAALPGARLFRGRELVEGRLAWSGLAYVLPADTKDFRYRITIGAAG